MKDLRDVIEMCVNYIEKNIYSKITLEELALEVHLSKYYLHRMFKSLTGETLMDYVQGRKLTLSIDDLLNKKERIIDIAMKYAFNYEQSYIRAFKKKFGFTPLKLKNQGVSMILTEKINCNDIVTLGNSITYKPFFMFKQKFDIVGMEHRIVTKSGDNSANKYGREFFYGLKNDINNVINPHLYVGYTDWSKDRNKSIYYMPSVQVKNLKDVPPNMKGVTIPPNKYVVFRFVGFFNPDELNAKHIGRVLAHLYRKWIFQTDFEFAAPFRLEFIDTSLSSDEYCELDIYQPIK